VLEFFCAKVIPPSFSAGDPPPAASAPISLSAYFLGNAGLPAKEKPIFYTG
jgi:hypothetical protein